MKKPYFSKKIWILLNLKGRMEKRTLEPSNGGMGTRLKTPKKTFIQITIEEKKRKAGAYPAPKTVAPPMAERLMSAFAELSIGRNSATKLKTPAIMKLDIGPEIATQAGPHF